MQSHVIQRILTTTKANQVTGTELIQPLWNQYGELLRVRLSGGEMPSVILKHIQIPGGKGIQSHPRGFGSDFSRQRKIASYRVETSWYEHFNETNLADSLSLTARCLDAFQSEGELFLLLEDLDAMGFERRVDKIKDHELRAVISWLASFHARWLNAEPVGLWPTGTYWHLETRPDELARLNDPDLKLTAPLIDAKLRTTRYQTIVHGDAKLANFCFSNDGERVAAVDFQYIGRGCGMKDLAYFVGSCLSESQCEARREEILEEYFKVFANRLQDKEVRAADVEAEWRPLYDSAWADFHRFLKGWSSDHWKINTYSERATRAVVEETLNDLVDDGKRAALAAGKLIRDYWQKEFQVMSKNGYSEVSDIVTEVDLKAQQLILDELAAGIETYDLGLLAEEGEQDGSRLEKAFFWTIDPLDGTFPFSRGESGFAVSIGLVARDGTPVIGVVYDPVSETLYHAVKGLSAFRNGEKFVTSARLDDQKIEVFADRTLKQAKCYEALEERFAIHYSGGAVMNAIHSLESARGVYFKFPKTGPGGCTIWDLAAVAVIVREAGGVVEDYHGESLSFNNPDTIYFGSNGLIICGGRLLQKDLRSQLLALGCEKGDLT